MRAKLIVLAGSKAGEFELGERATTIGRNPGRDIAFSQEEDYVSAQHATIRYEAGRYVLYDEGSLNGTFVNGSKVVQQELRDGDLIDFGIGGPSARFESASERRSPVALSSHRSGTMTRLLHDARTRAGTEDPRAGQTAVLKEFGRLVYERSGQRTKRAVLTVAGVSALAIFGVVAWEQAQRGELTSTLAQLEAASASGRAESDSAAAAVQLELARMREEGARMERELNESEQRLASLQQRAGADQESVSSLRQRVEELRGQKNERERFQELATRNVRSVALLYVIVAATHANRPEPLSLTEGTGTGFFVEGGYLVTNRHVADPLSYDALTACVADYARSLGFKLHTVLFAWRGGEVFRSTGEGPDLGRAQQVEVAAAADGRQYDVRESCEIDGRVHTADLRLRAPDNDDLALLATKFDGIRPLQLSTSAPRMLDPVMTLGFPQGIRPLEGTEATPQVSFGVVRKVEATVQFDAALHGGNSGGPLFGLDGRVVGITTYGIGDVETLSAAVPISRAQALMDAVKARRP